jgi:hypothetical protein
MDSRVQLTLVKLVSEPAVLNRFLYIVSTQPNRFN